MKQTISFCDFQDAFRKMDRTDNFTYEGKKALFDYLEQYEEECEIEIELDVVSLCCEYTEYENFSELQQNYTNIETMEELQDNTTVIMIDNESFIIQDY